MCLCNYLHSLLSLCKCKVISESLPVLLQQLKKNNKCKNIHMQYYYSMWLFNITLVVYIYSR